MAEQSVLRRIVVNSGWLLGGHATVAGLSLFQGILLAQGLGLESFGLFSLLVAVSASVTQLCNSRIFETVIRYVTSWRENGEPERAATTLQVCFRLQFVAASAAASLTFFGAPWLSRMFLEGSEAGVHLLGWMALNPLLVFANECNSATMRLANRYRLISTQQAVIALIKTTLIAALWWMGMELAGVVFVHLACELLGGLALMVMGRRAAASLELPRRRWTWREQWRELRNIIGFTFYTNLVGTSRLVTSRGDLLALGYFAGAEAAAVLALARRLTDRAMSFADPLVVAMFPEIATLVAQRQFGQLNTLLMRLTRVIALWVIPACVVFAVVADWVVVPLFGEDFQGSVLLIQIMIWRAIWLPVGWFNSYLLSLGRAGLAALVTWGDALAFFVFLLLLVPPYAAVGAAVATVLRCVLWVTVAVLVFRTLRAKQPSGDAPPRPLPTPETSGC